MSGTPVSSQLTDKNVHIALRYVSSTYERVRHFLTSYGPDFNVVIEMLKNLRQLHSKLLALQRQDQDKQPHDPCQLLPEIIPMVPSIHDEIDRVAANIHTSVARKNMKEPSYDQLKGLSQLCWSFEDPGIVHYNPQLYASAYVLCTDLSASSKKRLLGILNKKYEQTSLSKKKEKDLERSWRHQTSVTHTKVIVSQVLEFLHRNGCLKDNIALKRDDLLSFSTTGFTQDSDSKEHDFEFWFHPFQFLGVAAFSLYLVSYFL